MSVEANLFDALDTFRGMKRDLEASLMVEGLDAATLDRMHAAVFRFLSGALDLQEKILAQDADSVFEEELEDLVSFLEDAEDQIAKRMEALT